MKQVREGFVVQKQFEDGRIMKLFVYFDERMRGVLTLHDAKIYDTERQAQQAIDVWNALGPVQFLISQGDTPEFVKRRDDLNGIREAIRHLNSVDGNHGGYVARILQVKTSIEVFDGNDTVTDFTGEE